MSEELPRDLPGSRPALTAGALCASLATLVFMLPWWRSYLGLTTDGWYFFFAQRWREGLVPYRDFFLFSPPLHLFENAFLQWLFGDFLLPVHLLGVFERVALSAILFLWLSRVFTPLASLLATLASIAVFSGDINEIVLYINQDSIFWAVACGFTAASARTLVGARRSWVLVASGLLAGLAIASKQTIGVGISFAIPALWIVTGSAAGAVRSLKRDLAAWWGGWLLVTLPLIGWLVSQGAFGAFVEQVFLRGGASKGGLFATLLRPFIAAATVGHFGRVAVAAMIVLIVLGGLSRTLVSAASPRLRLLLSGAGLVVLLLVASSAVTSDRSVQLVACSATLFGCLALSGWLLWRLRIGLGEREREMLLMSGTGAAVAYFCSVSWPVWEGMVMPGLAVLLAAVIDGPARFGISARGPSLSRIPAVIIAVLLIFSAVQLHLRRPYSWGEWREPPIAESVTPAEGLPVLSGFYLSPGTSEFVHRVVATIQANSAPDEPVFVFPHLPLLYTLSGRRPPTFAFVHWFDVVPDDLAASDAKVLLDSRPAVLVNYEVSAAAWLNSEREFRGGRPSGQRLIRQAIASLGSSPDYRIVAEIAAPVTGRRVTVWARQGQIPGDGAPKPQ